MKLITAETPRGQVVRIDTHRATVMPSPAKAQPAVVIPLRPAAAEACSELLSDDWDGSMRRTEEQADAFLRSLLRACLLGAALGLAFGGAVILTTLSRGAA